MRSIYSCPVCHNTLYEHTSGSSISLRCKNGHSFDRHKKGYVNLLLAQHKKSRQPGDDSNMVKGRRNFLEAGHYNGLADKLAQLIHQQAPKYLLDAGCGEGFYLNHILSSTHLRIEEIKTFGFDISKPAIQAAASKYKHTQWAVASSARAPYENASFDCIISVFSRVEAQEFSRLLKPGGIVIYAGPGPNHLLALRELIYAEVKAYKIQKHHSYFNDDFVLLETIPLSLPITLNDNDDIINLVSMTPHGQRINKDAADRLEKANTLKDTADFLLHVYQKIR